MERKVDIDATKSGSASAQITDEEKAAKREERRARLAEVLDRGVVGDKLRVNVKDDMHYEWPHRDDVTRMQSLGFRVARAEDIETGLEDARMHDTGDGKIRIGDTVLMVCDKEVKEDIDAVKRKRYDAVHAPKGGKQKEEKEFEKAVDVTSAPNAASRVNSAKAQDITAAIDAVNRQKTS